MSASTSGSDIAGLEGRATFDELELSYRDLTLAQQQPAVIAAEAGRATIETLALAGSVGNVTAEGTLGLSGERTLDVATEGTLDIAAASAFTDRIRAEGPARFQIRADGTVAKPQVNGYLEVADATVQIDDPADVAIENLGARLDMAGSRVTVSRLDGLVNGGALAGSGFLTLGENLIADADLQVSVDELAFSAPLDLRSLSDVALRISRQDGEFAVDGQVTIAEAGLTGDVNFDTGILDVIGRPRGLDLTEERNPLLDRVRFNVAVKTDTPILVDNNLAKAEITSDLRLLGTPYELGLAGRMELLEGSTVTLNERRYDVERGVITFTEQRRITPSFDLRLTTQAASYDITLAVTGAVGETETSLTSEPSLPEPDIMALLVTGRTLDEMRGEEYDVAREQVLSYLTGRVGSALGRGIERATGLSEVRIEPNLIANEADPGARLTLGQELTDELRLVYSTDLADSSDQIWVAEYDITRRLETRVVRQSDNTYRMEFRHDMRFGGRPEPRRIPRRRPTVENLEVTGGSPQDEALVRRLLSREGRRRLRLLHGARGRGPHPGGASRGRVPAVPSSGDACSLRRREDCRHHGASPARAARDDAVRWGSSSWPRAERCRAAMAARRVRFAARRRRPRPASRLADSRPSRQPDGVVPRRGRRTRGTAGGVHHRSRRPLRARGHGVRRRRRQSVPTCCARSSGIRTWRPTFSTIRRS